MDWYAREDLRVLERNVFRLLGWSVHEDWDSLTEEQQEQARAINAAFTRFSDEYLWGALASDSPEEEEEEEEDDPTVSVPSDDDDMDVTKCIACGKSARWMCPTCKLAPFCGDECYDSARI